MNSTFFKAVSTFSLSSWFNLCKTARLFFFRVGLSLFKRIFFIIIMHMTIIRGTHMCTSTLIGGTELRTLLSARANKWCQKWFFFTFNITFDRVDILKRKKFLCLDYKLNYQHSFIAHSYMAKWIQQIVRNRDLPLI